jgi:hypothetical protein
MHPIAAVRAFITSLRRMVASHEPRLVRRVGMVCPHGRGPIVVDILTDHAGKPEVVLRCSAHAACPPTCDQSCRTCADAVLAPPHARMVYPRHGPLDDVS